MDKVTGAPGNIYIRSFDSGSVMIESGNGGTSSENAIVCNGNSSVDLYYSGTKKFETESTGIKVTGKVEASTDIMIPNDSGAFKVGASYDLQLFHDGGSSIIRNINNSASLYIQASSTGTNNIKCNPNGSTQLFHNGNLKLYTDSNGVRMNDSVKIEMGSASDFNFWHDGSHSHIQHMNTGNLYVLCQSGQINFETGSETMCQMIPNGAVKLYHNDSWRLQTTSIGVDFNGRITTDTNNTLVAHFGTTSSTGGYVRFGLAHNGGTIGYIGSPTQLTSAGDQDDLAIRAQSDIRFATGGSTLRCTIDTSGNFYPATTNASNLGSGSLRWNQGYLNKLSLNTSSTNSQLTLNGGSSANVISIRNTTLGNGNVGILFSTQDHSSGREKAAIYHQETHGGAHYGGDFVFCLNSATGSAGQVSISDERLRITRGAELRFPSGSRSGNTNSICAANGHSIDLNGSEYLYFRTGNTERMRVNNSGHIFFSGMSNLNASDSNKGINIENFTNNGRMNIHANSSAGNALGISFYNHGNHVGAVYYSSSATSYNTSSDYRLKENEVSISDGITRLKTLKPYRFNFKIQPDVRVDGFFAHEVAPTVPEAVQGEKDAEDMQQMDQSKLVPLLTAALQEAITKIETLETKVAALEGS